MEKEREIVSHATKLLFSAGDIIAWRFWLQLSSFHSHLKWNLIQIFGFCKFCYLLYIVFTLIDKYILPIYSFLEEARREERRLEISDLRAAFCSDMRFWTKAV